LLEARESLDQRVEELESELADKREQVEALGEAESQAADLRAEVQGLKERLQIEKRRAAESDDSAAEELEAQVVELTERITELEDEKLELEDALSDARAGEGSDGESVDDDTAGVLRERLIELDRLVDAIERTDLDPLSTVDRIRLQSAIRETKPKDTLGELLGLLESD
jgi:chromosome segregation ATPase